MMTVKLVGSLPKKEMCSYSGTPPYNISLDKLPPSMNALMTRSTIVLTMEDFAVNFFDFFDIVAL